MNIKFDEHEQIQYFDDDSSQDSDSSFDTSLSDYQFLLPSNNYVEEIEAFMFSHNTVSNENALHLNRKLQRLLETLKSKLSDILVKCKTRYESNKALIQKKLQHKRRNYTDYNMCGAPFFKDVNSFSAPPNEDYLRRKKIDKEFFPLDLEFKMRHHWVVRDKICLIQSVKRQVIKYLESIADETNINMRKRRREEEIDDNIKEHDNRLAELLPKTKDDFNINWFEISNFDLDCRHSEMECCAMWNAYLKPGLNKKTWSTNDENKLLKLATEYNFQKWDEIALNFDDRSPYQCILHYQTIINPRQREKNQKWTSEDDKFLLSAIESSRTGSIIHWNKVATYFPAKTRKQLYTRYTYTINPEINRRPFTRKEDCVLIAAVQEYGENNFSSIPMSLFPGRTNVQIRNRYRNVLVNAKTQRYWTVEDDKMLLELVEQYGSSNWSKISSIITSHSRISCRTRYNVIKKNFTKNPSLKIEDIPRKRKGVSSDITEANWVDKIMDITKNGDMQYKQLEKRREKNRVRIAKTTNFERLRPIEREYFNFFKCAYDYKFKKSLPHSLNISANLAYLVHYINIRLVNVEHIKKKNIFTNEDIEVFNNYLEQNNQQKQIARLQDLMQGKFYFPINWCTLIGLRGITILAADNKKGKNKNKVQAYSVRVDEAKKKFELRFMLIFFQTALLSRISTSVLPVDDPIFKITFVLPNSNPQYEQIANITPPLKTYGKRL